jgi:hypothetical protein
MTDRCPICGRRKADGRAHRDSDICHGGVACYRLGYEQRDTALKLEEAAHQATRAALVRAKSLVAAQGYNEEYW